MSRLGGWLGLGSSKAQTPTLTGEEEARELRNALEGATYILKDDLDTADRITSAGDTPFHKVSASSSRRLPAADQHSSGTASSISCVQRSGSSRTYAEHTALEAQRRAQKEKSGYKSEIYPPGTEYAICAAESQMMAAAIGVMQESLTESLKGFYKIRKAFFALDQITAAETKYLAARGYDVTARKSLTRASTRGSTDTLAAAREFKYLNIGEGPEQIRAERAKAEEKDDSFNASESADTSGTQTPANGGLRPEDSQAKRMSALLAAENDDAPEEGPDVQIFDNVVDEFIHSGANCMYGLLLMAISLTPAAFTTILSIVGFKGDRERGLKLLWQTTRFSNIHGSIAASVVLGFYSGMRTMIDIVDDNIYPEKRCKALMARMLARYPDSRLWQMERVRALAAAGEMEEAIEMVKGFKPTPLRQIEALQWWEHALHALFSHNYQVTIEALLKCIEVNHWSHGMYYFMIATAYVELYREAKYSSRPDLGKATEYARKTEEYLELVAPNAGKKKFLARQLPFDSFVLRKLQKWKARASAWGCPLIDAVGVSPFEEMIYWWVGHKKMAKRHLDKSLERLAWSDGGTNLHWHREELDEKAILALLRSKCMQVLGRGDEARELLDTQIIAGHRAAEFTGGFKDNWTAPMARYEMAVLYWNASKGMKNEQQKRETLEDCAEWLKEVATWGDFDLSQRVGVKILTAKKTLQAAGIDVGFA
ncbi:hypothetical protein MRB53_040395 [Persea americana]|nr:hypothetical protein MRB53_040395 [Persea americana]